MTDSAVTVVGAGPIGLTVANILACAGVPTLVLERHEDTVVESRAAVLDSEGLRALQMTGLVERLKADMLTGLSHTMAGASRQPLMVVSPSTQPFGQPALAFIHQPDLERELARGLDRFEHAEVRFGHKVTSLRDTGAGVTLGGPGPGGEPFEVRSDYVVACDGAGSTIREQILKLPFKGSTYEEPWLVVDCEEDRSGLPGGSVFCGDPARPTITAMLPGGRRRWEFMLRPGEGAEEVQRDEAIGRMMEPYADPATTGRIARRTVYRFHARRASDWRVGRVLLAGDAAHVMPPFAGQGMNSGLRDAANLSWKLRAVIEGAPDSLLDTYQEERLPHLRQMMRMAIAFGVMNNTVRPRAARMRDAGLQLVGRSARYRELIREQKTLPWPSYRSGALVKDRCGLVGQMIPQPRVRTVNGGALLDEVLGPGFALLHGGSVPTLSQEARQALEALSAPVIRVLPADGRPVAADEEVAVVDTEGVLGRWLKQHDDHVVLVRPDRFVMACVSPEQIDAALARVRRLVPAYSPQRPLQKVGR